MRGKHCLKREKTSRSTLEAAGGPGAKVVVGVGDQNLKLDPKFYYMNLAPTLNQGTIQTYPSI